MSTALCLAVNKTGWWAETDALLGLFEEPSWAGTTTSNLVASPSTLGCADSSPCPPGSARCPPAPWSIAPGSWRPWILSDPAAARIPSLCSSRTCRGWWRSLHCRSCGCLRYNWDVSVGWCTVVVRV